jgi:hypothetical protein
MLGSLHAIPHQYDKAFAYGSMDSSFTLFSLLFVYSDISNTPISALRPKHPSYALVVLAHHQKIPSYRSYTGDVVDIKTWLKANGGIDCRSRAVHCDRDGRAAIHLVAKKGHLAALEALIEGNADAELVEPLKGETALHVVSSNAHLAMARYLASQNIDLDAQNLRGQTVFEIENTEAIQTALLKAGASPNITSADGIPVLHRAIRKGFIGTVRKLVEKGANVSTLDAEGYSPLRLAYGHLELSEEKLLRLSKPSSTPRRHKASYRTVSSKSCFTKQFTTIDFW